MQLNLNEHANGAICASHTITGCDLRTLCILTGGCTGVKFHNTPYTTMGAG